MKEKIFCAMSGMLSAGITFLYGGWNDAMTTLLVFMVIDYISGLCVAIAGKSDKTESGTLNSKIGFKGLMKKGLVMLMLVVACRLDIMLDTKWYIRDATCIAFIINETISIIENAGVFIPIPQIILNVIDVLKRRSDAESKKIKKYEEENKDDDETKDSK